MELIAKFYNNTWSKEFIEQIFLTSEVNIKQDIKSFGVAELIIPIFPGIQEDVKIEIYESNSNQDRLIFRGFVYEVNPVRGQFQNIKIIAREEKALLQRRKCLKDYKFQNKSIFTAIEELLQIYNVEYNENWSFDIQKDDSITLELTLGDTYYDIFEEICEQKDLFRKIDDGKIIFIKNGNDLTDKQILEFDGRSPNPGNISNIEVVGTASGGNVAIVEDSNGKKTIDKSQFNGYLTGVVSKEIRKGDNEKKAKKFAEEKNRPQRKYQIEISNGSIEANIGDRIKVEVVNTNSFYDYSGDAIVMNRNINYSNAGKIIQYGISEKYVQPFGVDSWIEAVEKNIKMLRLKNKVNA